MGRGSGWVSTACWRECTYAAERLHPCPRAVTQCTLACVGSSWYIPVYLFLWPVIEVLATPPPKEHPPLSPVFPINSSPAPLCSSHLLRRELPFLNVCVFYFAGDCAVLPSPSPPPPLFASCISASCLFRSSVCRQLVPQLYFVCTAISLFLVPLLLKTSQVLYFKQKKATD